MELSSIEILDDGLVIDENGEIIEPREEQVTIIAEYDPLEACLVALEKEYADVEVPSCDSKEGYELVKAGCKDMSRIRNGIEKVRKIIKGPTIQRGKDELAESGRHRLFPLRPDTDLSDRNVVGRRQSG